MDTGTDNTYLDIEQLEGVTGGRNDPNDPPDPKDCGYCPKCMKYSVVVKEGMHRGTCWECGCSYSIDDIHFGGARY